jgi:hypothetical protein
VSNYQYSWADPRIENRPLSPQELTMQQRMFADPLSMPMIFKSWLISWLEISNVQFPMSTIIGLMSTLGLEPGMTGASSILNTGSAFLYAGSDTPVGTLPCDGSLLDVASHQALFNVIQYTFGGSGASFNLPNWAGPFPNSRYMIVE